MNGDTVSDPDKFHMRVPGYCKKAHSSSVKRIGGLCAFCGAFIQDMVPGRGGCRFSGLPMEPSGKLRLFGCLSLDDQVQYTL